MTVRRKLYGPRGTLLGTIGYPAWLDDELRLRGGARFAVLPEIRLPADRGTEMVVPDIRHGVLTWEWREAGAVRLDGMTLEEWERIPGHTFSPGAGYLRSIVEGKS